MKFEQVTVTPPMAREWMDEKNHRNRALRKSVVNQYARDMKDGKWVCTSQCITFDTRGTLIDGQHRLAAVIEANVDVPMMIAIDAPVDNLTYDVGLKRTPRDLFHFKYADADTFMCSTWGLSVMRMLISEYSRERVSFAQYEEFIEQYRDELNTFFKSIIFVLGSSTPPGLRATANIAPIFTAYNNGVSAKVLHRFYEVFITGFAANESEAVIIALRNKILKDYRSMTDVEKARRVMWAINKYEKGVITKSTICPEHFVYRLT